MALFNELIILVIMFFSIMLLDYLWLGILTKKFLIRQFGSLVSVKKGNLEIKLFVGVIAWFIIALGVYIFAVRPSELIFNTIVLGALFGFISYSIYDLTNLTFIKKYPLKFVFVDIAWGTVLCTILSLIGFFIKGLF